MELLGVTAIEDRLQDGVPECIRDLRRGGLKVWVLTGDKTETAINIAHASNLFSTDTELIHLHARNERDTAEMLDCMIENIDNKIQADNRAVDEIDFGLVVNGDSLTSCLKPEHLDKFLKLIKICRSVLCCRSTPLQKAALVKLVKKRLGGKVLAIGDGANDVSMIQSADVGIGISGHEGMQAVMASDYALARFRFLTRLLFVHGHWSYSRLALVILYFFYKNAVSPQKGMKKDFLAPSLSGFTSNKPSFTTL
uniref:PhoLip_ATPase_C domain-containing protein n=1 Tax=Steinernema glaseri TaxID=37863 RepID=A0A1I8A4R1_9BILA